MSRPIFSRDEWSVVAAWTRAAIAGALLVAGLWLALALISYDPADPSVFSATWRDAQNWAGEPGALTADLLWRGFGVASWAAPLALAVWALWIYGDYAPRAATRRAASAPLAAAAVAAFASAHAMTPVVGPASVGYGGLVGDWLFRFTASSLQLVNERLTLIVATLVVALVAGPLVGYALGASRGGALRVARRALSALRADGRWVAAQLGAVRAPAPRETQPRSRSRRAPTIEPSFDAGSPPLARAPAAPRAERWAAAPAQAPARSWRALRDAEPDFSESAPHAAPVAARADRAAEETAGDAWDDGDALARDDDALSEAEEQAASLRLDDAFDRRVDRDDPPVFDFAEPDRASAEPPADAPGPRDVEDDSAPLVALLDPSDPHAEPLLTEDALAARADQLERVLGEYGVKGEIIDVNPGPVVTQFELEPAPGVKASRVIALGDDIARTMSAVSARIATVPGRSVIGVELPNPERERVNLRALLADRSFGSGAALPLALGKDIAGGPVSADLAEMPHLLIAGTTGSGKSVAINTMLLSLLSQRSPEEMRLLLVDPKMLELSVYNDIPHLLAPVVTDPRKAVTALKWTVREMERRYERMARLGVRSLESYNERARAAAAVGERLERRVRVGFDDESGDPIYETESFEPTPLPMIVVVIDEMADLMLVAGKEIEHCIQRLAQMARASGIHLVMATQRPSVDVITGVIKANFPIRISFQVTSKIDSRTILGEGGAEQLLGKGDMLFTAGGGRLQRIHGPFVSDEEVAAVAAHLRRTGRPEGMVSFDESVAGEAADDGGADAGLDDDDAALYTRAVAAVTAEGRASTSFVQRRLKIGYNRAARLIEMMEAEGVVSPPNRMGKRELLVERVEQEAS